MDESVSKSQKKREAQALQSTGVALVELSLAQLNSLPLTENLYKAIVDAKSITSHGAKRRQAQLIGKLMRAADYETILEAYHNLQEELQSTTAEFHEVELWREKLLQGGKEVLSEFIDRYHPEEVQKLRQLIKKALDDQLKEKNSGAAKALFRYLRSTIK